MGDHNTKRAHTDRMKAMTGDESRHSRRSRFDIQVGVSTSHRLFVGLTSNISGGGLFIATREHLERGDRLEVRFSIPGSDYVFEKVAEVRWTRPIDEADVEANVDAGAGVALLDLNDDERRILNAFMDVHEPIFFEE